MTTIQVAGPRGNWPVATDVCDDFDAMAPVTGRAVASAVNLLWRMTGRRYGTRSVTLRPCRTDDLGEFASSWNNGLAPMTSGISAPVVVDGTPVWGGIAACAGCPTPARTSLTLPFSRVNEVTAVTIDGVAQDLTEFAVLDHHTIVWQSPDDSRFPATQDLTAPLGDPGTWSITVTTGLPLPADAEIPAGIFACELAKALSHLPCALPRNVVTVVRQGVTMQLADPDFVRNGLTGITEVDTWIRSVNPYGNAEPVTFTSIDQINRRPRTTTWTGS